MGLSNFELIQTDEYPDFDLKVTLKPSFRCNQNCWFCEEYDNRSTDWTLEQCYKVLDKLREIPEDKQKIWIYFYGGEPTMSEHWEFLHFEIMEIFKDRELFIQTQTNLSVDIDRLSIFLANVNTLKGPRHTIDICSSYHIGKQDVKDFKDKLNVCKSYDALGLCFFNTDAINEKLFFTEFNSVAKHFPEIVKLRFTEIGQGVSDTKEAKKYPKDDNIKSYEYRYFMKKYPELREYFEEGFNFKVDDEVKNFSEVSAEDIHKKFRLMKCECGSKNMVIDHNLKVYHCNDDFKNKINIKDLYEVDIKEYLSKNTFCLNNACYDGLEFKKWRD